MEPPSEDDLRLMAKARVAFKLHALAYVLVNLALVAIWWASAETFRFEMGDMAFAGTDRPPFWPIWPILGWGIGLAFHGYHAYAGTDGLEARELEKLRAKHGR